MGKAAPWRTISETSDANEDVAREMAADADRWPEATQLPTGGAEADSLAHAVTVLAAAGLR